MRKLINIITEADRLVNPTTNALKFWITDRGKIEPLNPHQHHFDYMMLLGMTWGDAFQKGWIRGFYEAKDDLICFDFDQRHVTPATRRTMLKMIRDHQAQTVIWDDTRDGLYCGSERLSATNFIDDLRHMA